MTRSRGVLLVALVVVVAAAVVVLVVGRGSEATTGVRPGAAYEVSYPGDDPGARVLDFGLPSGRLAVTVGTPVQDVAAYEIELEDESGVGIGDDVTSGDGARFVPVSWQLAGAGSVYGSVEHQFAVVLVADGRRYDLRAGVSSQAPPSEYAPVVEAKSLYAVVAGEPDAAADLTVEVTYEGLTQVGDAGTGEVDAGVAAAYDEPAVPRTVDAPCSLFTEEQLDLVEPTGYSCEVGEVTTSPYVEGLGWVDSVDETFVSVPVEVEAGLDLDRDPGGGYDVRRSPVRVRLDGRRPETTVRPYDSGYLLRETYVFRSGLDPRELELDVDLVATRIYGGGPRTFRFGGTQVFTLR